MPKQCITFMMMKKKIGLLNMCTFTRAVPKINFNVRFFIRFDRFSQGLILFH